MIKAVIFDAYGTLIDTKNGSVEAARRILEKRGYDIDPVTFYKRWKEYHRMHIDSLLSYLNEETIFLMDLKKLYNEYYIQGDTEEDVKIMLGTLGNREIYTDAIKTISELRAKYKVYIGSTSDNKPLMADIERSKIRVDGIFTSESLRVYKPKKEFFLDILKQIKLNVDEVIYVGDSEIDDLLGPSFIGMKSIWINRKNKCLSANIPRPSYIINELSQLLKIL
jgi:2-haloalkanoic acid dehalogenase type II